jgi:hypothetical protein
MYLVHGIIDAGYFFLQISGTFFGGVACRSTVI